ncbi:single insulin-like growth factor-binding domain protein-2 [Penaeus chinensis]|uniref:single insulin-like growth factor-binding domain protein-2 n=1 Tax=Penaeus chinensis TaxID=139456 RepID=UPI001FB5AA89|nr:single insulin-like growth factor-binding domain protein-2 [Penaeus chinensis]
MADSNVLLFFFFLCLGGVSGAATPPCPPCQNALCPEPPDACRYGAVKDACSCCSVCAKGPGELCSLPASPCASDLSCQLGICLPDFEVLSRFIRAADPQTFDPDRTQRHDHLHDHEPQDPDHARDNDSLHDHTRELGQ